jgi:hypothetical protein
MAKQKTDDQISETIKCKNVKDFIVRVVERDVKK